MRRFLPLCLILATWACARVRLTSGTVPCRRTLATLSDPDPRVNECLQRYNFPPDPFPWRMEATAAAETHLVYHVTFPSPRRYEMAECNTVHAEYYVPARPGRRAPGVVVLDILDGSFVVARMVARHFASAGIPSLIVKMPYYGERRAAGTSLYRTFVGKPQRMLEAIEGTVADVRRAACWLQQQPEVDPRRIGLIGVSLGGIIGALAVAVDPRFDRNVLVLAGGDPVDILWHAPETGGVRDRLMELGYTLERLRQESQAIDPITFGKRVNPRQVLMINASADTTVLRRNTLALWEAFGRPAIQWYPAGHYSISLFIPAILPTAAQFILSAPTGR